MTLLASKVARTNDEPRLTAEHFQALGRLTLAFVLFWAYLSYAQFFIVWIADIPQFLTRSCPWYRLSVVTILHGCCSRSLRQAWSWEPSWASVMASRAIAGELPRHCDGSKSATPRQMRGAKSPRVCERRSSRSIQRSIPIPVRALVSTMGRSGDTSWMFLRASSRLKPTAAATGSPSGARRVSGERFGRSSSRRTRRTTPKSRGARWGWH